MTAPVQIEQLEFNKYFILRMPAFPFNRKHHLPALLKNTLFLQAIKIASPAVYEELSKHKFDPALFSEKLRLTLWKYCNRMTYRPTPFGLFSSLSVVRWEKRNNISPADECRLHILYNFSINQQRYLTDINGAWCNLSYTINPTLYRVSETFRYLSYSVAEGNSNRTFHVNEVTSDELLLFILNLCNRAVAFTAILNQLCKQFQLPVNEGFEYIRNLVSASVIVPEISRQLNITGRDYLIRDNLALDLKQLQPELYINTIMPLKSNALATIMQKKIKDGLYCLSRLSIQAKNQNMEAFVNAFKLKFDRQTVPLLQALDPGIGIGYGVLAVTESRPAVLRQIELTPAENAGNSGNWSAIHQLLMNKWLLADDKYAPVKLDKNDIASLPDYSGRLPNSFSVLFRIINGTLFIEQAGGATGTALSGRFTPFDPIIKASIQKLARVEEEANPDVIFAEICHIEDMHTANIDRREHLYRYEIPILCGSALPAGNQLPLSDLHIFMADGCIQLWSESLQKRVIPRLSSAYNYQRSNLSVFRFLCDLQYEQLHNTFNLDMQYLFPGQSFYPRVTYGDTILHLATWLPDDATIEALATLDIARRVKGLKKIAADMKWPVFVSLNEADNQLVFNLKKNEDLYSLAALVKIGKKMILREFIQEDKLSPLIKGAYGKCFVNQFVTTLYHAQTVYQTILPVKQTLSVQRLFVPGSEWLYYKLYIHASASNELLTNQVRKTIVILRRQGLVKKWFFIRYYDTGYHLRIRIHLKPLHTGYVMARFGKVLDELATSGIIKKYAVDTYERELERYSAGLIAHCEDHFCRSTDLILSWLEKITTNDTAYEYYYISWLTTRMFFDVFGVRTESAAEMLMNAYQGISDKYPDSKVKTTMLKQKLREISKVFSASGDLHQKAIITLRKPFKLFSDSLHKIASLTQDWDHDKRLRLISDLLHMHLNRLLVSDSTQQELILYYCMSRMLQSENARAQIVSAAAADNVWADQL
jgi:thiopeptide-type bacteriocin biosynthesis protein